MKAKIPATVLTGFLGAGKTTMIRHLLANANGKRIALIINEFGDLGIDAEIVKGCAIEGCAEEDVVELANGCICCAVADDFIPTMEKLLARANPPDHIVIETSGLALPKPLVKAFNWPEVKSRVTVSGVIAVVDAPAVASGRFEDEPRADDTPHDNPLEEVFEDQLLCADLVVLNKCDQFDHEALSAVRQIVAESLRPGVKAIPATRGAIDLSVLLGLDAEAENDVERRRSHHDLEDDHDHEDFESFVVPLPVDVDPAALEIRIRRAAGDHPAPSLSAHPRHDAAHDTMCCPPPGWRAAASHQMRAVRRCVTASPGAPHGAAGPAARMPSGPAADPSRGPLRCH